MNNETVIGSPKHPSIANRAIAHLAIAEQEAARAAATSPAGSLREIAQAAVVGAGTMGAGIAMTYANAGIPVMLKDVDPSALDRALATIRRSYESAVSKGRLTPDTAARRLALVTPTTTNDGLDRAGIVVEAVFEELDLKQATFRELAQVTQPSCILASNTSTLDVDRLADASGRPALVLGHHFFAPAHVMKLLEIVRGRDTAPDTIAASLRLATRLGKLGVIVGNAFGFVANRLLAYYRREALLLLEEGASAQQIDGALTAFGMPIGPFAMQDLSGIDIDARIRRYLRALGKTRADGPQSDLPEQLYEMGRYGQKTGAGWYTYPAGSRQGVADPLIDRLAQDAAARRGITPRSVDDDEIISRTMAAVVNEGARILDEGIASSAADIDLIFCHGFGFPRERGGPMFYADTLGLPTVLAQVQEYRARFGDHWKPARLLESLAAEGHGFCG